MLLPLRNSFAVRGIPASSLIYTRVYHNLRSYSQRNAAIRPRAPTAQPAWLETKLIAL